jgi:spermidine/putrescine-binding protein
MVDFDYQRAESSDRKTSRRDILKVGGATLAGTSLAGCTGSFGSGGGSGTNLVLSISGGSWGEWVEEFFVTPWEEDTGNSIDVRFESGGSRASKLQANKNDPIYDLAHGSNGDATGWGSQDLIVKHSEHVENFERAGEAFRNEWLAGKVATPFGIGYNTDEVDMDVTSWDALLEPEFKGKVAVPAWGWMGSSWLYVINNIKGGTAKNIEPGLEFVRTLIEDQNAKVMENTDNGLRQYQNGEIFIAPYWSARTDQITMDSNIDMQFVYPQEGAMKFYFNLALLDRGDTKLEASADFLSSTLLPKRQAKFSENVGYPPTNPNAVQHISDEAKQERPSLEITEQDMSNMAQIDVDWTEVSKRRSDHAEQWRRIVRG